MSSETAKFAAKEKLVPIMNDYFHRAHKANSVYPLGFLAEEITKVSDTISPPTKEDKDLIELRKLVNRFYALFENLKSRDAPPSLQPPLDDEASYRKYAVKHDLHKKSVELIAMAFVYSTPEASKGKNPLEMIAHMIFSDIEHKILRKREVEDLERRQKIITQLVQHLLDKKPVDLGQIRDFSVATVRKEMGENSKDL